MTPIDAVGVAVDDDGCGDGVDETVAVVDDDDENGARRHVATVCQSCPRAVSSGPGGRGLCSYTMSCLCGC